MSSSVLWQLHRQRRAAVVSSRRSSFGRVCSVSCIAAAPTTTAPLNPQSTKNSNPQTGEFTFYGTMAYSDPFGFPIDYLLFELHKPALPARGEGSDGTFSQVGKCETRLDPDYSSAPKVRLLCEALRTDLLCGVPDYLGTELDFAIVDGKMSMTSQPLHIPARDCYPASERGK
jgi:hypothetical protein